jgi:alkaline phosphatase
MLKISLLVLTFVYSTCLLAIPAKNAILFIGDGFGPSVVNATRVHFYGKAGQLHLDKFPHTARVKTYAVGDIVTDSAAAGTAMASGVKTLNGVIGKDAKYS